MAIDFSEELALSVQQLREYLTDATSLPPEPPSDPGARGWFAGGPHGSPPWVNIVDFAVTEVAPFGALLTFTWSGDENVGPTGGPARRYAIFLGAAKLLSRFQLDKWVTALDIGLGRPDWHSVAFPAGDLWYVPIRGS